MTRVRTWRLLLVFVCALAYLASGIRVDPQRDSPPFDIDEAQKLSESYYYHLFFEEGAWRHPDWRADFYARVNPPVAKYIFGAVLAAEGLHVHDLQLQSEFDALWRTPAVLRRQVPDAMLRVTRGISAVYGALICTVLFWVGERAGGLVSGLGVALLLLTNPYFLLYARSGLTDTMLVLHLTLITPASLWAASALRGRRTRGRLLTATVLVPGLVVALATGTKMNGSLTALLYGGSLLLAAIVEPQSWPRRRLIARSLLATALAAGVAVAVLVALNPTFHDAPVARLRDAFVILSDWMEKQQMDPGPALFGLRERAAFVSLYALAAPRLGLPRPLGPLGGPLTGIAFSLGLVALVAKTVAPFRVSSGTASRGSSGDAVVVLGWIVGVVVAITTWVPVGWDRYALPPATAVSLAAAIGLGALPDMIRFAPRHPGPVAAIVVATGVLSIAVAWVTDPLRVDPRALPQILRRSHLQRGFLDLASSEPEAPASQEHAGEIQLMQGHGAAAAARFEVALGLLPVDPHGDRASTVHRSILLFELTRARAAAGNFAGAREALLEHLTTIEQVRAELRSGDPWVDGAFDRLKAERGALVARLTNEARRPGP